MLEYVIVVEKARGRNPILREHGYQAGLRSREDVQGCSAQMDSIQSKRELVLGGRVQRCQPLAEVIHERFPDL